MAKSNKRLIQLRVEPETYTRIKQAADMTGTPVTRFMLYHGMVAVCQLIPSPQKDEA